MTHLNFYAIEKSDDFRLSRVRLTQDVQTQLSELFEEQRLALEGPEVKPIGFEPDYKPDDNEVFAAEYATPEFLSDAIDCPEQIDDLHLPFTTLAPVVKGIVGVDPHAQSFYFQHFNGSLILDRRRVLLYRGDTFNNLDSPGITVAGKMAATLVDGSLRFKSFSTTRQFLDLRSLFQEATAEEIEVFLNHEKFHIDSADELVGRLSDRLRKRFAVVIHSEILENPKVTPRLIQQQGKKYAGLEDLRYSNKDGSTRLILPTELSRLEKLLRFLAEELYIGDLTGNERVSNSSRTVVKASS